MRPVAMKRNTVDFPDTLGRTPIVVRSLVCVGGTRPGRKYLKRRQGYGPRIPTTPGPASNAFDLRSLFPMLAAAIIRRGLR